MIQFFLTNKHQVECSVAIIEESFKASESRLNISRVTTDIISRNEPKKYHETVVVKAFVCIM